MGRCSQYSPAPAQGDAPDGHKPEVFEGPSRLLPLIPQSTCVAFAATIAQFMQAKTESTSDGCCIKRLVIRTHLHQDSVEPAQERMHPDTATQPFAIRLNTYSRFDRA